MSRPALYVALDVDDGRRAVQIARAVSPYAEGFKVGPGLFFKEGKGFIGKLKLYGKVFLDFKFFDIPSTMVRAVRAGFYLGADMVTVHAGAGGEALRELSLLEQNLRAKREFRILAVSVLTSFSNRNLPYLQRCYAVKAQVESLAALVMKSGLRGLVCAGGEVQALRKRHPGAYLLVPGVRFKAGAAGDQKRVFTLKALAGAGADAFVMGRPIYQAKDPAQVCAQLVQHLAPKNLLK